MTTRPSYSRSPPSSLRAALARVLPGVRVPPHQGRASAPDQAPRGSLTSEYTSSRHLGEQLCYCAAPIHPWDDYPPRRDSCRSRSLSMRRITTGLILPSSRKDKTTSRSAASSSRRHSRQAAELSAYSSVVPPASRPAV